LHQLSGSTIDGAAYTLDNAGNRTAKTDELAGVTSNYAYDAIYELTGVTQGTTTTESYTFDPVGNRLSSLGVSPYDVNVSNELTSTSSASYTYDNNGNTLTKVVGSNTTQYFWDYENRMSSVTLPGTGGTVSFKYDPFGRRIYKSSSSGTSVFAYDGDNLVEETNSSGTVVARYSQGLNIDEPLAMLRSSTTSFYQADGLGSVTSLSNSAGSLAQTYTFDSFGNQTASSGSLTNPFQYTARENDPETGLYYYRARYYDMTDGRFLSEDPIQFDGGSNFYVYVENDPNNWTDPLGLRPLTKCEKQALAPYIPQIDLDNADLHDDGKVPKWFLDKSATGVTDNNHIYFRPGAYNPSTPEGLAALGHELVHVGQYRRKELTKLKYIIEASKHGSYLGNKYERPAYAMEDLIKATLPAQMNRLLDPVVRCACSEK
jgi:RHS repeat-associated protein